MSEKSNFKSKREIIIVSASVFLLISGAVYGITAYQSRLWPFNLTTSNEETNNLTNQDVRFETLSYDSDSKMIKVFAKIDTNLQGDCKLKLKKGYNTLEFKSSSIDIERVTGCEDWNFSSENLETGVYDVEVIFTPEGGASISSKSKLKIE